MRNDDTVAWLVSEVNDLLDVSSVGLYEFMWLLRTREPATSDATLLSYANEALEQLIRERGARLVYLVWGGKDAVADGGDKLLEVSDWADPEGERPYLAIATPQRASMTGDSADLEALVHNAWNQSSATQALLSRTRSPLWSERDEAVRGLAANLDEAAVVDRLVEMLLDDNTAVIQTVVDVLVRGLGADGLRRIMPVFAADNDEDFDAREHMGDRLSVLLIDGVISMEMIRELGQSSPPGPIRDGARDLVELFEPPPRQWDDHGGGSFG